jgi:hypothetical protein
MRPWAKKSRIAVAAAVATITCGCNFAQFHLTVTTSAPVSPKAKGCEFSVTSVRPERAAEDIAILDSGWCHDIPCFKEAIRDDVCKVGGDVVVAQTNESGYYVKGTVLRWRSQ